MATNPQKKRCFVISEFGPDEKTRVARKQTLKHLVKKVLEPMGYEVQRADDIDDPGQITHQIIERLLDDDLVVADLTGLNPNVFYELAVRHAAKKPVVTLMSWGEPIPFDVKDVRTVFYDLHDPDKLEAAQEDLRQKVNAVHEHGEVRNPITVARNVTLLQQSDDPEVQATGAVLSAVTELQDEVRTLARLIPGRTNVHAEDALLYNDPQLVRDQLVNLFRGEDGLSTAEVAERLELPASYVDRHLRRMNKEKRLFQVDGKWSTIPF